MNLESIKCLQKYYEVYDNTINKCPNKECEEIVRNMFINGLFRIMNAFNRSDLNFNERKFKKYDK